MEKRNDLICGIWKFKDTVASEELEAFAEELAQDEKYIHVYIRKVSKDQFGIGVTYKSETEVGQKEFGEYTEKMKDILYRKFGAGLVGWDFANTTQVFKGF